MPRHCSALRPLPTFAKGAAAARQPSEEEEDEEDKEEEDAKEDADYGKGESQSRFCAYVYWGAPVRFCSRRRTCPKFYLQC